MVCEYVSMWVDERPCKEWKEGKGLSFFVSSSSWREGRELQVPGGSVSDTCQGERKCRCHSMCLLWVAYLLKPCFRSRVMKVKVVRSSGLAKNTPNRSEPVHVHAHAHAPPPSSTTRKQAHWLAATKHNVERNMAVNKCASGEEAGTRRRRRWIQIANIGQVKIGGIAS